jgi:hypothetical protein
VNAFLYPYEPLQEIVDEAITKIHRELGPKSEEEPKAADE